MDQTSRRKRFIINFVYFVIICAIFALILEYAFYPLLPIFIAILVAIILQRPVDFFNKKFNIPRSVVATILVLIILALLCLGVYALGEKIVIEVIGFAKYIQGYITDYDWVSSQVYKIFNSLPKVVRDSGQETVDDVMAQLKVAMTNDAATYTKSSSELDLSAIDFSWITGSLSSGISSGVSGVMNTAKQIPSILVAIIICIVLCVFMTIEYKDIIEIINKVIGPSNSEKFEAARTVMKESVGKLAKAYFLICCITFAELSIGLSVLTVLDVYSGKYVIIIALITALLDILPILGIGTVMWPWMAYCLITGNTKMLVGLFLLYCIITVIRHIIEPKLISNGMELPAALTLSVMYIGLKFFGVVGMFAFVIALYCIVELEKKGIIHLSFEPSPEEINANEEVAKIEE